jgi:hypothetical protein
VHYRHKPQFRIGGRFRLKVNGFHINQCLFHGNRKDIAPDNVGPRWFQRES